MLERLLFIKQSAEHRDLTADQFFDLKFGNVTSTTSGERVDQSSVLGIAAVWACIRIISDGVSTLPYEVTLGKGANAEMTEAPHWLEQPSPTMDSIDFRVQVMISLLLRGNAYVLVIRDENGLVLELIVLDPDKVSPKVTTDGRVMYQVEGVNGLLDHTEIMHLKGLILPGSIVGISPLDQVAETLGLTLAVQRFGSAFFGNGAMPSAVVEVDGELSPDGARIMKRSWEAMHRGASKAQGLAVLTSGAKFKQVSIAPEQAQFLATRGFQVAEIARIFGVPPHLIQDASGSTSWGSGLSEQSVNYVTHTLRPWVTRLEAALTRLARSERPELSASSKPLYVRLSMESLVRGDYASRIATYRTALEAGIYNLDEVREMEGRPPLPDGTGQIHRVPLNTGPVDPTANINDSQSSGA